MIERSFWRRIENSSGTEKKKQQEASGEEKQKDAPEYGLVKFEGLVQQKNRMSNEGKKLKK